MYDVCNTNGRVKRARLAGPTFRFLPAGPQYQCALHKKEGICWQLLREFSRPVLPLLDCRPPLLVRVALDGGRMLATSARTTDACTAPLIANTGFQTKGTGTATAGCLCMTSSHRLPSLQSSLSRPVLLLLGCRPPMLVRIVPERGRMRRASRTLGPCSRAPLLVLGVRGRYVGSRRFSDGGDDIDLPAQPLAR